MGEEITADQFCPSTTLDPLQGAPAFRPRVNLNVHWHRVKTNLCDQATGLAGGHAGRLGPAPATRPEPTAGPGCWAGSTQPSGEALQYTPTKSSHIVDSAWGTRPCFGLLLFCLYSRRFFLRWFFSHGHAGVRLLATSVIAHCRPGASD